MSYIRIGSPLKYVKGNSNDYIFPTSTEDGKEYIQDYGSISNSGFIELLFEKWDTKDKMFKEHMLKRLADRLNVELRKKPLTEKQLDKLYEKNMEEFEKDNPELHVKKS